MTAAALEGPVEAVEKSEGVEIFTCLGLGDDGFNMDTGGGEVG